MLVSKDERELQKGRDQIVASSNGSVMLGSSDMQKNATENIHKSCTKDEKLPQRRLVPTAANEVLYQRSSVLKAEHTHNTLNNTGSTTESSHTNKASQRGSSPLSCPQVDCICTVTQDILVLQRAAHIGLHIKDFIRTSEVTFTAEVSKWTT